MMDENKKCILSLCLPIYNRIDCFIFTFDRLIEQMKHLRDDEQESVEVIVSVNPHEEVLEKTRQYLLSKKTEYDFTININENNIGGSENIKKAISLAQGKFIWVIGDDDLVLDGTIKRIIRIIKAYDDLGWLFLSYARLDGYPNDSNTKLVELNNFQIDFGHFPDGKTTAMRTHQKVDGHMLFSSANIFLKAVYYDVQKTSEINDPQLGATFASAAHGSVYLDRELGVLGGGAISWGAQADYNETIRYFKDMYSAVGHGYKKEEIDYLVKYRMRHAYLRLWYNIYRLCIKGNRYGKESLVFFIKLMPVQTVITSVLLPVIAPYLFIRHMYRNKLQKRAMKKYSAMKNADPIVVSRIKL